MSGPTYADVAASIGSTMDGSSFSGFGLHPHSGIATLTYLLEGSVGYQDTTGAAGILPQGGVEWFKAGHGAWHA